MMIFAVIALKLEKGLPNFFKFQSISTIAIRCIRRQETVSIPKFSVKKTKLDNHFWNSFDD